MTLVDLKMRLGTAVKTKRALLRMSQEELAHRAGLHRTYVSDVERGARNPSLESIEKLARALDFSISSLFAHAGNGDCHANVEILLVEDRAEDVELTLRAFRKARFTNKVHVAHDGEEALAFLFATGRFADRKAAPLPGVILLDLDLPKIDGVEVLRKIKADERCGGIPVVVLTVSRDYRDAVECRRLGVENYLVKPVNFQNFSEIAPHLEFGWKLVRTETEGAAWSPP